jgi:hypothetical protein
MSPTRLHRTRAGCSRRCARARRAWRTADHERRVAVPVDMVDAVLRVHLDDEDRTALPVHAVGDGVHDAPDRLVVVGDVGLRGRLLVLSGAAKSFWNIAARYWSGRGRHLSCPGCPGCAARRSGGELRRGVA